MSEAKTWEYRRPADHNTSIRTVYAGNELVAIVGDDDQAVDVAEKWGLLIAAAPEMLVALEYCCVIAKPGNPDCCCPNYQPSPDGDCAEAKNGDCHIWKAIQKARGQG